MHVTRILIIMPAWIGDLVISSSFVNALKKNNRDLQIDILVNENLADVAKLIPNISNIILSKTKHKKLSLLYRIKLGLSLKNKYSRCYILTNSFKSAIIPFIAGIRERIGYIGEFRYGLINCIKEKIGRNHGMANRYLNLINEKYESMLKPNFVSKLATKKRKQLFDKSEKYIVFCPDAEYGPAKKWPIENWIDLACKLIVNYRVIFVGLDLSVQEKVNNIDSGKVINLIGETNLMDVIDIISHADCVVSNDSGLMHISSAFNRPVVAIYGSSSPVYTPPLNSEEKSEIVYKALSCSPCFKSICPLGHTNCLNNITVQDVQKSVEKLTK